MEGHHPLTSGAAIIRSMDDALPITLLRARMAVSAKFKEHSDARGLSPQQWRILRALAPGEPLDSRTLAQRCALLAPSVSRIVRSLKERGLVVYTTAPDKRARPLALTCAGRALFDEVAVISEAVYHDIEEAFGRDEMAALVTSLQRLIETCEALPRLPHPETLATRPFGAAPGRPGA